MSETVLGEYFIDAKFTVMVHYGLRIIFICALKVGSGDRGLYAEVNFMGVVNYVNQDFV